MLAPQDDGKESMKRQLEDQHPEWREPKYKLRPIGEILKSMIDDRPPIEHHSHDPWWIMRVEANRYRAAEQSLRREGFEFYSPTYRILRQMPLRLIPPKKRHNAKMFKIEATRRRFEGYAFVRRMRGAYDANRLFDLQGCGGIVKCAGSIALVHDYEVELLRLVESDGTMDDTLVAAHCGYKVTRLTDQKQWVGQSRIVGRLDDSHKTVLFVERMGRIARLIQHADPA